MIDKSFIKNIGYEFNNVSLLEEALTHSSAANERAGQGLTSNERLEFLGDAVLNLAISNELFDRMGGLGEGQLSKIRAFIVCEKSLAECGRKLGIDRVILLSRGEEISGGRNRPSIIADAVEALIGSVYIDGGFERAASFVISVLKATIDKAISGNLYKDYKTEIQELLQSQGKTDISYKIEKEAGPDHDKTFSISLWNADKKLGQGKGKTKKEAEQNAAKAALEVRGIVF